MKFLSVLVLATLLTGCGTVGGAVSGLNHVKEQNEKLYCIGHGICVGGLQFFPQRCI